MSYRKNPENSPKILKKKSKKSSECLVIIPKSDRLSGKTEIKTEKS
jgi:hypothetical protein